MNKRTKIILFALILAVGVLWMAVSDGEQAEAVRAFLRLLLRRLF